MTSDMSGQPIGVFFFLALCTLADATRLKGFTQPAIDGDPHVEPASELGVECAWPHLRTDLAP